MASPASRALRNLLFLALLVLLTLIQGSSAELEPRASGTASKTARTKVTCSTVYGTKSRRSVSTTVKTRTVTSLGKDVTRTITPTVSITPPPVVRTNTLVRTSITTTTAPTPTDTKTFWRTTQTTVRSVDWVIIESTVTSTRTVLDYTTTYIPPPAAWTAIELYAMPFRRSDEELGDEAEEHRDTVERSFEDHHHHHDRRALRHYPRSVECLKKLVYYTHNTIKVTARTPYAITVPAPTVFSTTTSTATRTVTTTPPPVTTTTTDWTTLTSTSVDKSTEHRTSTSVIPTRIRLPGGPTNHVACHVEIPPSTGNKPVQVYNRGWSTPALSMRYSAPSAPECCDLCHDRDECMASAYQTNGDEVDIAAMGGRCMLFLDPQARYCTAGMTTPFDAGFFSTGKDGALTGMVLTVQNGQCGRLSHGGLEANKPKL
ncbi:hypothetical protein A4X09_0g6681 [Tilletia walkeri]|uniref:Apple domain-containing protein n=1 Tax=Tilletia walkeri TaxID=117179 RepID=A0A8X7N4Q2_9BASI|nr:hypothetical protein A4X09_0g6681 [Tilletia walkeri]